MALIFCSSAGSNTSPYDTWAKAATDLQTAITQAANGDTVVLQYNAVPSGDAEVAANKTYTFDAHCALIAASADDASTAYTPTAMGTGTWIGNSTTARTVTVSGAFKNLIYGVTFRSHGASITLNTTDGGHHEYEDCRVWNSSTATSTSWTIGNGNNGYTRLTRHTFDHDRTSGNIDTISAVGLCEMYGCTYESGNSSTAAALFPDFAATNFCEVMLHGCDFSQLASGTTMIANNSRVPASFTFTQCKMPANVVYLASQTSVPNRGSANATVIDCSSGDTHGIYEYHDAFGSCVTNSTVYFTAGAAAQSWKITTTANCGYNTPFVTPWIPVYHTGTSAITPYLEILRDGSTTAYNNDEVWGEFAAKVTTGSTRATFYNDRRGLVAAAAAQANGAGLGSWTGESGTAWSGKVDSGSSLTPAESGDLCARVCVGLASIAGALYVDPQVRT